MAKKTSHIHTYNILTVKSFLLYSITQQIQQLPSKTQIRDCQGPFAMSRYIHESDANMKPLAHHHILVQER